MKKFFGALALCLLTSTAFAQLGTNNADNLTPEEAQELFLRFKVENDKMKERSECFDRANIWARIAETAGVTTDKTFVFFTYKFKMQHTLRGRRVLFWGGNAFSWWFHVAPTVNVNGELWALDATFTDSAMPIQDWMKSLQKDPEECVEMTDRATYVADRNRRGDAIQETCYYTNTSKYIYNPFAVGLNEVKGLMQEDLRYVETPAPTTWNRTYLNWSLGSYEKSNDRKAAKRLFGL